MYAGVGAIPNPLEWLREKIGDFLDVPGRLEAIRDRAREIMRTDPDPARRREAADIYTEAYVSLVDWRTIRNRLRIGDEAQGLGAVPVAVVVVGVSAAAVATAAAALFRKTSAQEKALELLEAGTLTAADIRAVAGLEQADAGLSGAMFAVRDTVKLALLAAAGFVGFKVLQRKGVV